MHKQMPQSDEYKLIFEKSSNLSRHIQVQCRTIKEKWNIGSTTVQQVFEFYNFILAAGMAFQSLYYT